MSERIDSAFNYDWVGEDWCPSQDDQTIILGPEPDPWHRPRKGLLANEVPFRPGLRLSQPDLVAEALNISLGGAENALLANVLYAHARSDDTQVFYSRDHNVYARASKARRYLPGFYTYATLLAGVTNLERDGLITEIRTAPSLSARLRSRISASPDLLHRLEGFPRGISIELREVIILRDAQRHPLNYSESDRTFRMRRDVLEHNDFLSAFDICLDHPNVHYDEFGFLRANGSWIDPSLRAYRRIFNGQFTLGGRWYGPFWQSLPKDVRAQLLINAENVVEHDYRACHLRLLYAQAGIDLPFRDPSFDPYQIAGYDRSQTKAAFHIMVNASTERAALSAIARELSLQKIEEPRRRAVMLADDVHNHFHGLERFWCSGVGLWLQHIDAEICRRVQRRLRSLGIPVLSVHDSFIVPMTFDGRLADVMEEEMCRACSTVRCDG